MAGDHAELRALYEADQADRADPVSWQQAALVVARDADRHARVEALIAGDALATASDFFHAAMICQHAPRLEDIKEAHALARRAIELDPSHARARWLVAASEDRALVRRGLKQKWGTQFHIDQDGRWSLSPYDETTTDEERAAWGVPPIAEAHARVRTENAKR